MARGADGTLHVEDPSTGESLAEVADGSGAGRSAALDAAVGAPGAWAPHAPRERGEILRRAFELIIARADELALLMTLEMGKPLSESAREIDLRGRVPALVLRGGGADRRSLRDRAERRRAAC